MNVTHHGRTVTLQSEADIQAFCRQHGVDVRPAFTAEDRRLQLVYHGEELDRLQAEWWHHQHARQTMLMPCFT